MGDLERFWEKVQRSDSCWEWTGCRLRSGYGQIKWGDKIRRAHRVSWEIHFGPIPDGLWVLHHCDNPPCVRPDHLYLGTLVDNAQDCVRRGRHYHWRGQGEGHPMARLTEGQVLEIRRQRENGLSGHLIARAFGLSKTQVYDIINRKSWAHLAGPVE